MYTTAPTATTTTIINTEVITVCLALFKMLYKY